MQNSELQNKLVILSILLKNKSAVIRYEQRQMASKQAWQAMARKTYSKRSVRI